MAPMYLVWIPPYETEEDGVMEVALSPSQAALRRVTGNRSELSGTVVYLRPYSLPGEEKKGPITKIQVTYDMKELKE